MSNYHRMGTANREIVKRLFDHLIAAFEQFADQEAARTPDGLSYIDAFMGCHNFYKAVIMDLERRAGDERNFLRMTAIDTLALALGIPIERSKQ